MVGTSSSCRWIGPLRNLGSAGPGLIAFRRGIPARARPGPDPPKSRLTRAVDDPDGGSGAEALGTVSGASPVDLLVTDVRMPGVQGPDLARRLRVADPRLPVVFVSAFAERFSPEDLEGDAPSLMLEKPFSSAALSRVVRDALDWPT